MMETVFNLLLMIKTTQAGTFSSYLASGATGTADFYTYVSRAHSREA